MPEMDGILLAKTLREEGYGGKIILLSTSKDFGPESYLVNAFSYLLKPPTIDTVNELLKRVEQEQLKEDRAEIIVDVGKATKIVRYREISCIEVVLHKLYFYLTDGSEVVANTTLSKIKSQLLCDQRFIQCHRSYIVNMQDIAEISEKTIITQKGKQIPVSRSYKDTRNKFYQWKFGGVNQ